MQNLPGFLLIFILTFISGCSSRHVPAPTVDLAPHANAAQPRTQSYFDLSGHSKHKVKEGETLYSIAWQANLDFKDLAQYNNIQPPYTIAVGQVLQLGKPKKTSTINKVQPTPKVVKKTLKQRVDRPKKQEYGGNQGQPQNIVKTKASGFPSTVRHWKWPAKVTLVGRFSNKNNPNKGIDISGKQHSPILATAAGKVVYTGKALKGYGNLVIIKHTENFLSAYAHNETVLVKEQQWIKSGQQIATMGKNSEKGSHLHFEIRYKGTAVDPLRYLQ